MIRNLAIQLTDEQYHALACAVAAYEAQLATEAQDGDTARSWEARHLDGGWSAISRAWHQRHRI